MMKKFISKVIFLISIVAIIFVSLDIISYLIQSKASFKVPPDKHILVIGDSHTECAIDDNIYSSAVNISQSASCYLYSHSKLKKFLSENNHIDTVLISFHYSPLKASHVDNRWIFGTAWIIDKIPHHLFLLEKDDIAIFTNNKTALVQSILYPPYGIIFKFITKKGNISYEDLGIGGYLKLYENKLKEDIVPIDTSKQTTEEIGFSFYQIEYLLKIVDLCKSKNVELILINTPTYKPYRNDKLNDFYNTYLKEVKYVDYSAFSLPDSCYGDIGHLNYKGAKIFSKYLQENFSADIN